MTIAVYVVPGCPHCEDLMEDLRRLCVSATVVDLSLEPERVEEVERLTWQRRVPVVVDHERATVGFRGGSSALDGHTAAERRSVGGSGILAGRGGPGRE